MSGDRAEADTAGEREDGLDEESEELPGRVIHVEKDVWRASRLEYITKNVRAGRYQVDMERLADKLLPQIDALTRRRK
jgi:anti-sigma28 factor (negative regulator of flagellin synthesis)